MSARNKQMYVDNKTQKPSKFLSKLLATYDRFKNWYQPSDFNNSNFKQDLDGLNKMQSIRGSNRTTFVTDLSSSTVDQAKQYPKKIGTRW